MNETELMKSVKRLKQDVSKLKAKVDGHIGDVGADVHGLPANGEPGFMPFNLYKSGKGLFEKRIRLDQNTDINTLPSGFYSGNYLVNIPEDAELSAAAFVNITCYDDGRKELTYTQSWKNVSWRKVIHAPNSATPSTGWFLVPVCKTIFSGAITSGSATLSLPKTNFVQLQFIYSTNYGNVADDWSGTAGNSLSLSKMSLPDGNDHGWLGTEMTIEFTSQTEFAITKNITANTYTTVPDRDPSTAMTLQKIVGWNI